MTVHGAGMLTGALLAMMGALWFVLRPTVALSVSRMLASYLLVVAGATGVIVAVLTGGCAAGWTFLTPLPFHAAGQWTTWATVLYLAGLLLVGMGFFVFAMIFALGFLALLAQFRLPARAAVERRYVTAEHVDSRSGGHYLVRRRREENELGEPQPALQALPEPRGVPLSTLPQLAVGVATAVVALAAFFPQVVDASETSARYHHLDHAAQFLLGVALGVTLGSLPAVAHSVDGRFNLGLAAVLAASAAMLLVMVPRFYEPLEQHPAYHALSHVGMAALGLVAGLGTTRLGSVLGRFAIVLAIGMAVMFAGTAGG